MAFANAPNAIPPQPVPVMATMRVTSGVPVAPTWPQSNYVMVAAPAPAPGAPGRRMVQVVTAQPVWPQPSYAPMPPTMIASAPAPAPARGLNAVLQHSRCGAQAAPALRPQTQHSHQECEVASLMISLSNGQPQRPPPKRLDGLMRSMQLLPPTSA